MTRPLARKHRSITGAQLAAELSQMRLGEARPAKAEIGAQPFLDELAAFFDAVAGRLATQPTTTPQTDADAIVDLVACAFMDWRELISGGE